MKKKNEIIKKHKLSNEKSNCNLNENAIVVFDVFGVCYTLCLFDYECEYFGYTDCDKKYILIDCNLEYKKLVEVLTHELLHAYFFECGLECYSSDETLIRCLGCWFLNINNLVADLVCIINKRGFCCK